jgi:hypothetical protein
MDKDRANILLSQLAPHLRNTIQRLAAKRSAEVAQKTAGAPVTPRLAATWMHDCAPSLNEGELQMHMRDHAKNLVCCAADGSGQLS